MRKKNTICIRPCLVLYAHRPYTHGDHGAAVRVRVPRLLVELQRALRRDHPDERRHLRRQVIDLVRVLAGAVFAAQQRIVGERLVLLHLDALAAARLILRRLGHRVELRGLVLCASRTIETQSVPIESIDIWTICEVASQRENVTA